MAPVNIRSGEKKKKIPTDRFVLHMSEKDVFKNQKEIERRNVRSHNLACL